MKSRNVSRGPTQQGRSSKEFAEDLAFGDMFFGYGFEGITHAYGINEDEISHALYHYSLTPNITVGTKNDPRERRAYRECVVVKERKCQRLAKSFYATNSTSFLERQWLF